MDKALKIILIISIAVFGAGLLLVLPTNAQVKPLVVEFERKPLFSETNLLPSDSITRWVKVTNNSGQGQRIATEAINVSDADRLGDVLNLEIKEGGKSLYNNALSKFFTAGEVYLSDLAGGGAQTQYDFIVTFYSGTGNPFQGKSLGFDLLVGFQGVEGGLLPGAGFLPSGFTILGESVTSTVGTTSVTIIWTTSYLSTSQVIYAKGGEKHTLDLTDNVGIPPYPPKYGYAHTTLEYDVSPKVTFHSVTITGLTPGTTYYYRCVSHASLAVSTEYSFTTLLGIKEEKKLEEGVIPPEEEIPAEEVVLAPTEEGEIEKPEEFVPEGAAPVEERAPETSLASLLLASLGAIRESSGMMIIVILCVISLGIIGIREWERARKKKK